MSNDTLPPLPEPIIPIGGSSTWSKYNGVQMHAYAAEAVRVALAAQRAQWQPIETAPKDGRKIIVSYVNHNGKTRTVMARWLTQEAADEIDHEGVGLEAGWFECIDNWSDYTEVAIHEGEPTHWMPIPAALAHPRSLST